MGDRIANADSSWERALTTVLTAVYEAERTGTPVGTAELKSLPIWQDDRDCIITVESMSDSGYVFGKAYWGDDPHICEYSELKVGRRGLKHLGLDVPPIPNE